MNDLKELGKLMKEHLVMIVVTLSNAHTIFYFLQSSVWVGIQPFHSAVLLV